MDIIVGTAGHIDHGKTALVKALTGIDADRLPEEKERGITIDLGFAEMRSDDVGIGFVDVPGHERFVKNMLAGASGIDLVLLVVAADEGVMPQTREHFDICRLLRIKNGIIALTKTDLADAETLELAKLDVAELVDGSFLENAPVIPVSSKTNSGIPELRAALIDSAKHVSRESDVYEPRLSIDRTFSVKGFGAVVTGTLASSEVIEGDELEIFPARRPVRVRGIQTHGKSVKSARAGQRTAINLGGIGHDEIERGMVLAKPGSLVVTQIFDGEIEVLADASRPLRSRQRVRVHLGTEEVLARVSVIGAGPAVEPGSRGLAQFRLESPVAAAHGDRFIIRSYSPQRTIAGGVVLDPLAQRHRAGEIAKVSKLLGELSEASSGIGNVAEIFVRGSGERGLRPADLHARTSLRRDILTQLIQRAASEGDVIDAGGVLINAESFGQLTDAALKAVEAHHRSDKFSRGFAKETLREQVFKRVEPEVFRAALSTLERGGSVAADQDVLRIATHTTQLSAAEKKVHDRINEIYMSAQLEAPKLDDALAQAADGTGLDSKSVRKIFQLFIERGELVAVTNEFYFPSSSLAALTSQIREHAKSSGDSTIDVAKFKDIARVSRKYAIPLLEYLDRTRVTRRVGDKRQIL